MDDSSLLEVLHAAVDAVHAALGSLSDWGPAGTRPGQYLSDLAADRAMLDVLEGAGLGVLSEETGLHHPERPLLVVADPVDGSTNASRGLPWYATSLCALDSDGPRAAVVANQATGTRYEAVRGGGARRQGQAIGPSACTDLGDALVAVNGLPSRHLGWRQFRCLGAAALDLCAVADGSLDAYMDCTVDAHGPWDYLGGMLVCQEAGAAVVDAFDRPLVARRPDDRRTPVAASSGVLLASLISARSK
ncbi:MAG: inositol monophosphatase [Acidimicrobiales bacterium]